MGLVESVYVCMLIGMCVDVTGRRACKRGRRTYHREYKGHGAVYCSNSHGTRDGAEGVNDRC